MAVAAREVRNLLLASEGEAFGERVEKAAELEPAHHRAELRAGLRKSGGGSAPCRRRFTGLG